MKHTRKARKEQRRAEAIERQDARNKRSDEEQLNLLVERGKPHCREANRLVQRICLADMKDSFEQAGGLEAVVERAKKLVLDEMGIDVDSTPISILNEAPFVPCTIISKPEDKS